MRFISVFFISFLLLVTSFFLFKDFGTDEIVVAVLDSGINENHKVFKGKLLEGYNFSDMNKDLKDESGHGTGMAGLVLQSSDHAKILPVKVLDGSNTISVPLGIFYSIFKGADVINMSFSDKPSSLTQFAIKYGQFKDVIFVGAVGNYSKNEVSFPARVEGVYAIGNVDIYGQFSDTSNFGERIDFVTNGRRGALPSHEDNEKYKDGKGTSLSTARFSGYIAQLMYENPNLTKKQLTQKLIDKSKIISVKTEKGVKKFREIQGYHIKPYKVHNETNSQYNQFNPHLFYKKSR